MEVLQEVIALLRLLLLGTLQVPLFIFSKIYLMRLVGIKIDYFIILSQIEKGRRRKIDHVQGVENNGKVEVILLEDVVSIGIVDRETVPEREVLSEHVVVLVIIVGVLLG